MLWRHAEASGRWEAMVLPFDVQQIMNEEKNIITPMSPAGSTDGLLCWVASVFVAGLRDIRPFEAYMLNTDVAFYLLVNICDTRISAVLFIQDESWYTLQGVHLDGKPMDKGVYIHDNKVVIVKQNDIFD